MKYPKNCEIKEEEGSHLLKSGYISFSDGLKALADELTCNSEYCLLLLITVTLGSILL